MPHSSTSPVSLLQAPLNLNYDSDDDMHVDSEIDHPITNIKEPDPDADGESVDDDASPPPSTINIAGPSLSHRLGNSVGPLHCIPFLFLQRRIHPLQDPEDSVCYICTLSLPIS